MITEKEWGEVRSGQWIEIGFQDGTILPAVLIEIDVCEKVPDPAKFWVKIYSPYQALTYRILDTQVVGILDKFVTGMGLIEKYIEDFGLVWNKSD